MCVFKNDFPELHTEIKRAIKSQNDALHLPVMSEIAVTPNKAAPPTPQPPHPFQQLQHPLMQPQFPHPLRKHPLQLPPFLSRLLLHQPRQQLLPTPICTPCRSKTSL